MNEKRKYDSTVARIAGNIAGHLLADYDRQDADQEGAVARQAVRLARLIVAEVEKTDPKAEA